MAIDPKDSSLLQKMSAEVAPEVSPLLRGLLHNARLIGIVLTLCVLGAAAYGGWRWHSAKTLTEAQTELGRILVIAAPADRAAALKDFRTKAPEDLQTALNLALAQISLENKDYETAVTAWDAVAKDPKGSLYATAQIGTADALSQMGKDAEALAVLEGLKNSADKNIKPLIDSQIVDLAEKVGDYAKALAACDALLGSVTNPMEADFWRQKAASIRLRQAETKKPS